MNMFLQFVFRSTLLSSPHISILKVIRMLLNTRNMFNTLHIVGFAYGLSIYEVKRVMCHHGKFITIAYGNYQHLTNFLNR